MTAEQIGYNRILIGKYGEISKYGPELLIARQRMREVSI